MAWFNAILPEGMVRDETTFIILVVMLAALVGVAMYLRAKRNRQPDWEAQE
jgi:hypothetical protein